jgi:hypothetical protein
MSSSKIFVCKAPLSYSLHFTNSSETGSPSFANSSDPSCLEFRSPSTIISKYVTTLGHIVFHLLVRHNATCRVRVVSISEVQPAVCAVCRELFETESNSRTATRPQYYTNKAIKYSTPIASAFDSTNHTNQTFTSKGRTPSTEASSFLAPPSSVKLHEPINND